MTFDHTAISYSPFNALYCAKAARLAYSQPSVIEQQALKWQFPNFSFFDSHDTDTQAFMMGNDKLIVLVFRGTSDLRDWRTNAKIMTEPLKLRNLMNDTKITLTAGDSGYVHRGFLEGLDSIWKDIITKLDQFRNNSQALLVTGHSLGAALATLAVARLHQIGEAVRGLYTYGSPRVGDQEFVDNFNTAFQSRAFRFVNHNDVVTRVAPRSFGYSHVNSCLYFDSTGKLHNDVRFWQRFLESVKGSIDDFISAGTEDHKIENYEQKLQAELDTYLTQVSSLWAA